MAEQYHLTRERLKEIRDKKEVLRLTMFDGKVKLCQIDKVFLDPSYSKIALLIYLFNRDLEVINLRDVHTIEVLEPKEKFII